MNWNLTGVHDLDRHTFAATRSNQQGPAGRALYAPAVVGDERLTADLCFEDQCGIGVWTQPERVAKTT